MYISIPKSGFLHIAYSAHTSFYQHPIHLSQTYIHTYITNNILTSEGKDLPAFKLRTMLNTWRFLLCWVRVIRAATLGNMTWFHSAI